MNSRAFADVTALTETGPGRFAGTVSADWTIGGKPNGGYLLAMLGRAAGLAGPHPHPIAASAHYLHSPDPGAVTVEAEVLRAGRSASQVSVRMLQDGQACVVGLFTVSLLTESTPFWSAGVPDPGSVPFTDAQRVPGVSPTGVAVTIMDQVDLRVDPADLGFAAGHPSGRGELHGWLALADEEPFDPTSLLYAVDAFPPATFEIAPSGWVPTLELTCYIRALPAPGPVRVLQKAQLVDAQRVDESCFVWDSTGRLVAQSTQLAGIRLG